MFLPFLASSDILPRNYPELQPHFRASSPVFASGLETREFRYEYGVMRMALVILFLVAPVLGPSARPSPQAASADVGCSCGCKATCTWLLPQVPEAQAITSYQDPGWYEHPEGTVAEAVDWQQVEKEAQVYRPQVPKAPTPTKKETHEHHRP